MMVLGQKQIDDDHKLPALKVATDDASMALLFNGRPDLLHRLELQAPIEIQHALLKYTPGKRCVLNYELHGPGKAAPRRLIGKLYRDERGAEVFQRMRALWRGDLCHKVPRPFDYIAALGLVLQYPVRGQSLATLAATQTAIALPRAVESAAQNLAQLHAVPAAGLPIRRQMSEHLTKYCRPHPSEMVGELKTAHPELSHQAAAIVEVLTRANLLEALPLCTVHNDLNLAHIYWEADHTTFIDLDGLCGSHAELDVATLSAALGVYLGEQGHRLAERFLAAYMAAGGKTAAAALHLYEAFVYLRRATICYRKRHKNSTWVHDLSVLLEKSLQALP